MTRVLVQRGSSGGSSSNSNPNPTPNRSSAASSSSVRAEPNVSVSPAPKNEESGEEVAGVVVSDEILEGRSEGPMMGEQKDNSCDDEVAAAVVVESDVKEEELGKGVSGLRERVASEIEGSSGYPNSLSGGNSSGGFCPPPPPPPVPPPKPSTGNLNSRRNVLGSLSSSCVGSLRHVVSARTSPAGSRPSSPRGNNESEGYNSADEQMPCYVSSYDDFVS